MVIVEGESGALSLNSRSGEAISRHAPVTTWNLFPKGLWPIKRIEHGRKQFENIFYCKRYINIFVMAFTTTVLVIACQAFS